MEAVFPMLFRKRNAGWNGVAFSLLSWKREFWKAPVLRGDDGLRFAVFLSIA